MYWLLQIAPIILPLTNDMRTMRNMGPPVAPSVSPPFAMKRANSDAFAFAITRVAIMDAQLWMFKDMLKFPGSVGENFNFHACDD